MDKETLKVIRDEVNKMLNLELAPNKDLVFDKVAQGKVKAYRNVLDTLNMLDRMAE